MALGELPHCSNRSVCDIDTSCHVLQNLDPSLRKRPVPVTQVRRIPTASRVIGNYSDIGRSCRSVEFKPDAFPRPGPDDAIFR